MDARGWHPRQYDIFGTQKVKGMQGEALTNATLQLRGLTLNYVRYAMTNGQPVRVADEAPVPWRLCYNGNPRGMVDVVEEVLPPDTHVLFIVQRDVNRNVVVYAYDEARRSVRSFWFIVPPSALRSPARRETDPGEDEEVDVGEAYTEELTLVEQNVAYGAINGVNGRDNEFSVRPLKTHVFRMERREGKWVAVGTFEGKEMIVREVFICTEASAWLPWPSATECHVVATPSLSAQSVTYHYSVALS